MASGGVRAGTPGKGYTNRTDLNATRTLPPTVGPSQQYGQAAALQAAQEAVPMGVPLPPQDLTRPTERPGEPVTAGSPSGPGPNSSVLGPVGDPVGDELRALYQAYPNEDLRELIEDLDAGVG